jgi:hypothetical protein
MVKIRKEEDEKEQSSEDWGQRQAISVYADRCPP